jgi:stage III sporulation protein AB
VGLKLALGAIAILCSALIGRAFAKGNVRRAQLLAETMDGLQMLKVHMLDRLLPLNAALEKSQSYLLRETGLLMNGCGAREAWQALRERETRRGGRLDSLLTDDLDTLDAFFDGLGSAGRNEHKAIFDAAIKALMRLESVARKAGAERVRLYTTLGALAGVAAVIGFI